MANIILRLSGGAANVTPALSLGGAMSTVSGAIINPANNTLNNLWDDITKAENFGGITEYRCVYIHNDTAVAGQIFASGEVFITGSPYATIQLGLGPHNTTTVSISPETAAPVGITFSSPTSSSPLLLPSTLQIGERIALWIKRTATNIAGTGTVTDTIPITVRGVE